MLQLVYMWIENFRTLKNINLNFHSNFEFEFEPIKTQRLKLSDGEYKESVVEGKLKIKKFNSDDEFIYKYFPENQFISLIVGKNGTGKTSIFDLIYMGMSSDTRYFTLFLDTKNKQLIIWGVIDKNFLSVEDIQRNDIHLKLPSKEEIYSPTERRKYLNKIPELSLCYITSQFEKEKPDSFITTFCEPKVFSSYTYDFYRELEIVDNNKSLKDISCLAKYENVKQIMGSNLWINFFKYINFFDELTKIDKNIKLPEVLLFSFRSFETIEKRELREEANIEIEPISCKTEEDLKNKFIDIHLSIKQNNSCLETYLLKMFSLLTKALDLYIEPTKEQYFALLKLASALFQIYYIYNHKMLENKKSVLDELCSRLLLIKDKFLNMDTTNISFEDCVKIFFDELSKELEIPNKNNQVEVYTFWKKFFINIENIIKKLENILDNRQIEYRIHRNQIAIKKVKKISKELKELSETLKGMFFTEYPLIILNTTPPLSSGQKRLINLFAKIEELINNTAGNLKAKENVLLLLDEPDVYLHPEWQRLFIHLLTEFLKMNFPKKNFHIIIATHSPFILSDIPKGNCVFLELDIEEDKEGKIQEYKTVVKPKEEIHDTLAQNIYYLLADGFFMEKGIGEYIRLRLSEILTENEKDYKFYKELVSRIGDEIYKKRFEIYLEKKLRGKK